MKRMLIALILGLTICLVPVSAFATYDADSYVTVNTWNGDTSLVKIVPTNTVQQFQTNSSGYMSDFAMQDNYRLCTFQVDGNWVGLSYGAGYDGFVSGDVSFDIYYDFNKDGEWSSDEYVTTVSKNIPVKNDRYAAIDISEAAVSEYGTSSYAADMAAISAYIYKHYKYNTCVSGTTISMSCIGGAFVLETWSIYKYGVYGWMLNTNDSHTTWRPENLTSGYYDAQGWGRTASEDYESTLAKLEAAVELRKAQGI